MTLLLPVFALLTGIAVLAVLWPMFKRHPLVPRDRFELAIYRDQLAEVERDRERGLIPADQARAARLEIERRLLRAAAVEQQPADVGAGRRGPVLAAALLVPLFAMTLYAVLGSPGLPFVVEVEKPVQNVAKKWWFWTATGGVLAVLAGAGGLTYYLLNPPPTEIPIIVEGLHSMEPLR